MSSAPVSFLHDLRFEDVSEMAEALQGWSIELTQVTPGAFRGCHRAVAWPGVLLQEGRTGPRLLQQGVSPPHPTFCVLSGPESRMTYRGREQDVDEIRVMRPGEEIHVLSGDVFHVFTLTVDEAILRSTARGLAAEAVLDAGLAASVVRPEARAMQCLRRALGDARDLDEVLRNLIRALAGASARVASREARQLDVVAQRVVRVLDEHPQRAVTVGDLVEATGASERTLRRAVRAWYGVSPKQLVRARRLGAVRRALVTSRPARTTVADVAFAWGFQHLSRFAFDYRCLFDEYPSETLARGSAPQAHDGPERAAIHVRGTTHE